MVPPEAVVCGVVTVALVSGLWGQDGQPYSWGVRACHSRRGAWHARRGLRFGPGCNGKGGGRLESSSLWGGHEEPWWGWWWSRGNGCGSPHWSTCSRRGSTWWWWTTSTAAHSVSSNTNLLPTLPYPPHACMLAARLMGLDHTTIMDACLCQATSGAWPSRRTTSTSRSWTSTTRRRWRRPSAPRRPSWCGSRRPPTPHSRSETTGQGARAWYKRRRVLCVGQSLLPDPPTQECRTAHQGPSLPPCRQSWFHPQSSLVSGLPDMLCCCCMSGVGVGHRGHGGAGQEARRHLRGRQHLPLALLPGTPPLPLTHGLWLTGWRVGPHSPPVIPSRPPSCVCADLRMCWCPCVSTTRTRWTWALTWSCTASPSTSVRGSGHALTLS